MGQQLAGRILGKLKKKKKEIATEQSRYVLNRGSSAGAKSTSS